MFHVEQIFHGRGTAAPMVPMLSLERRLCQADMWWLVAVDVPRGTPLLIPSNSSTMLRRCTLCPEGHRVSLVRRGI